MPIEEALKRAREDGVEREENLPFWLEPEKPAGAGVVLVHGFSATPWEMRRFGEAVTRRGYIALGVRLPGHGTTPEDLARRTFEEWQSAVEEGITTLSQRCRRVYGIGLSTGALLLLAASAARPLKGLVLLSPFLRLRHRLAPAAGLLRRLRPFRERPLAPEMAPYYYSRQPLSGIYQLHRLTRRVRHQLPRIETPSLVVSAEGDQTANVDSAFTLYRRLGSRHKELHLYGPEVPHVLTTPENPRWQETRELTLDFLQDLEDPRRKRL